MQDRETGDGQTDEAEGRVAALEHLTGPSRGKITWLGGQLLDISVDSGGLLACGPPPRDGVVEGAVARLRRVGAGHAIEALGGNALWVNRRSVTSSVLRDHDMIEFCERGPISRYLLFDDAHKPNQTVTEICADAIGYFRASRKPVPERLAAAAGQVLRRLSRETTLLFRLGVVLALALLVAFVYQQYRINALLLKEIESGSRRLEDVSRVLARTRDEALTPQHLEALRLELATRVTTSAERIATLERRSVASARIIERAAGSIALLQGAYGFREIGTGRMLRHVVNEKGRQLFLANGLPLLSLDGQGPVAERQFNGTGFLLKDSPLMITNRHVGAPWEHDGAFGLFESEGVEPVTIRFIAYLPGIAEATEVSVVRMSDAADIAILDFGATTETLLGLELSATPPMPGDRVIVLGYPTGLRSILAQAGEAFVKSLQESGEINFWTVAERLSAEGRIVPLASQGIVGRVSNETIVYDAATTSGGSGGPVLDADGAVIAINAAILPEYGGSNLGVPVSYLRELLAELRQ